MKIKAIAPWFGAKRNMAARISEVLGPHKAYWEPFCGSMAVLLGKKSATMETVNDLNGDLINLARVLQKESTAITLYGSLSRVLMSEGLFKEHAEAWKAAGRTPASDDLDLTRAFRFSCCRLLAEMLPHKFG